MELARLWTLLPGPKLYPSRVERTPALVLILRKRSASGVDVQRLSIGLDPTIRLVFSRRGDKSSRLVTDIPVFSQRQATVIG